MLVTPDITGNLLLEGDKVVYSSYGRGNSIALAQIERIYERNVHINFGLRRLDSGLNLECATRWDSTTNRFEPTEKLLPLVTTKYEEWKFFKIKE